MSRVITRHPLRVSAEPQGLAIQRRSRILSVVMGAKGPELIVDTDQDATTRALDVSHNRQFVVLEPGDIVPDGAVIAGVCAGARGTYLVYELPGVKPTGL